VLSLFARLLYYFQQFPRQKNSISSRILCQFVLIIEATRIKENSKVKLRSTIESKDTKLLLFLY